MNDAPETIWAGRYGWHLRNAYKGDIEYRRADLPATPAQIAASPEVRALVEALREIIEHCQNNGIEPATVGERVAERCETTAIIALAAFKATTQPTTETKE